MRPILSDEITIAVAADEEPRSNPKRSYALQIDGVGDRIPTFVPLVIVTTDTVPGTTASTATLTVGAPHTLSTIDSIGDLDFYRVTLTAGTHYQVGMYGYTGGPSLTPLGDSYVEIYDAAGTLITSGDGGASTPANMANSGFDVLLDFIPTATGTYYVNARAFDNAPADGTNGDMVGDYELFVQLAPPNAYQPYYEPDQPLYAIDWGTRVNKVNQSAANPDGNEGTRATGNAQGTPVFTNTFDVNALAAQQGVNITGKNVITIYFARVGDVFTSLDDPASPGLPPATITAVGVQGFERTAVLVALGEFAKVADLAYVEVQDRAQADFVYTSYQGTPGPGVSLLGSMSPPDEPNEGLAQFNSGDNRWNALNLQQGGFSFVTLIHEFGHGHGLAHPHDNGGRSGIMRGVEAEGAGVADYTTGDFALNQSVFTMMSYEDGWQSSPYGNAATNVGYGYLGGLMAFDIAAIQDKYGVNEEWATGDDTYTLKDVNAAGTYFSSIWDGGGTDSIVYSGTRNATIDLRAATLNYEVGGGGNVSFATGIFGGFTIANGVTIENASSGGGSDTLIGNAVTNTLSGGLGNDLLVSGGGTDTLLGGGGNDRIEVAAAGSGSNVDGGADSDTLAVSGAVSLAALAGIEAIDLGTGGALTLSGDQVSSGLALTTQVSGAGSVIIDMTAGVVLATKLWQVASGVSLTITGTTSDDLLKLGDATQAVNTGDGADRIKGGNLVETAVGGTGDDKFMTLGGADVLSGGAGNDVFRYRAASDSGLGAAADRITDFAIGQDRLNFGKIDADAVTGGDQAFAFLGTGAFTNTGTGQIRFEASGSDLIVQADVNGDGTADMAIVLQGLAGQPLTQADFVL